MAVSTVLVLSERPELLPSPASAHLSIHPLEEHGCTRLEAARTDLPMYVYVYLYVRDLSVSPALASQASVCLFSRHLTPRMLGHRFPGTRTASSCNPLCKHSQQQWLGVFSSMFTLLAHVVSILSATLDYLQCAICFVGSTHDEVPFDGAHQWYLEVAQEASEARGQEERNGDAPMETRRSICRQMMRYSPSCSWCCTHRHSLPPIGA